MEFTIKKSNFTKALNHVVKAISVKPNIAILSNILIQVDKSGVTLSATNLEMGITMWLPAEVVAVGSTTVSGRLLNDFVAAQPEGQVNVKLDKQKLVVSSNKANADFQIIPAEDFPILPKTGDKIFRIDLPVFLNQLALVVGAASTDMTTARIQFTGVLMDIAEDNKNMNLVATDTYHLSLAKMKIDDYEMGAKRIIIPAKSLSEFLKIASSISDIEDIDVYLSGSNSQIIFKVDSLEFSSRLIDGEYPDYKRLIPTENAYSFLLDKAELEQGLKIMQTFARSVIGNKVTWDLDLETNKLMMDATITDLGNNSTRVDISEVHAPADLKDAYNLQYLQKVINNISGNQVKFDTNSSYAPAIFTDPKDDSHLHLVMPMQRD